MFTRSTRGIPTSVFSHIPINTHPFPSPWLIIRVLPRSVDYSPERSAEVDPVAVPKLIWMIRILNRMNPNTLGTVYILPSMSSQLSKARPTGNRSSRTRIHLLDDDSLLIIFSFCRPVIFDESEATNTTQILAGGEWKREWWWHRLIQVCRRWRYLVLDSAFHLRVSLVCGRGTPVADMLAHSPPVPLIIDHIDEEYDVLTPEDEEGIILALQHRDRVRRIRIMKSISILQKIVIALDGEFPILEYLLIKQQHHQLLWMEPDTHLKFPETLRAPHLCQLVIMNFSLPIESPMLTSTMGNLVVLSLNSIPSSGHFLPPALLQRLSLMTRLETFGIFFNSYEPNRDVERNFLSTHIMTRVTLPNLRWFGFQGTSAYLEALLPWVTIPLLERLQVYFFNQPIYSIPRLQQFMSTARNLRIKTATVAIGVASLGVTAYLHKEDMFSLDMDLRAQDLDWQVVSAAQVFPALKTVFSAVEHLIIEYNRHNISSEWNRQPDRTYWREFLGSFDKVKTLRVEYGLVEQVSRALQPDEGESSTELFPELQELVYSRRDASGAFALFVDARQKAGLPLTVNLI